MNEDPPSRGGRPKKDKEPQGDFREPFIEPGNPAGWIAEHFRERNIDWIEASIRVDPLNDDSEMALWLGRLICGIRDEDEERHLGRNLFIRAVAELTADEAEAMFERIVKLKRNYEGFRHRNAWAYLAYRNFMSEFEKEPTKRELKSFILSRPGIYQEAPQKEDFKAWERMWDGAGLHELAK